MRRGDPETVQVGMLLSGQSIMTQDRREAMLDGGDMVLYDSSRLFTLVKENQFHWQICCQRTSSAGRTRELPQDTAIPLDVLGGEVGVLGEDLFGSHAVREHRNHCRDREAQSPDAGQATHDSGSHRTYDLAGGEVRMEGAPRS